MSQRGRKANYWQDAAMPRGQPVLIPTTLEEVIPAEHPVRLVDEALGQLDAQIAEASETVKVNDSSDQDLFGVRV